MNVQVQPENTQMVAHQPQMPIGNYHEFYHFYLTEHRHMVSRRLHVAGSSIGLCCFTQAIRQGKPRYFAYGLLSGYACAWIGHFIFERNKPASFKQPVYSFISDISEEHTSELQSRAKRV